MTIRKYSEHTPVSIRPSSAFLVLIVAISLVSIVATYLLANSALEVTSKTTGFGTIVALFLAACICINWIYSARQRRTGAVDAAESVFSEDVDRGLRSLEEASSYFAGSLGSSDAFRLVSSRVRDLLPFESIILYLLDETRTHLIVVGTEGNPVPKFKGATLGLNEELPGQCYSSGQVEIAQLTIGPNHQIDASVAIPLCRDTAVFGVLQLFFEAGHHLEGVESSLFEAVGTRVAPVILGSIAFERSQKNALTDITTDLPNERAFYLVLENQVAETQRNPENRPLTILSIDIKGFDEINQKFGHGTGNSVLKFVAQTVKDNLRQMDFFARSFNDEFIAVLPTATKEVSHEIIARIHTGFFGRKMKLTDTESIELELNIGWAAFGDDGETPGQMLTRAHLRKDQMKSGAPSTVIIFPQEHVH